MPLVATSTLINAARAQRHGIAAFNVITLEHAEAIAAGAESAGRAAILQLSENAVKFHGGHLAPIAAAVAAIASQAKVPMSLHLDHVEDETLLRQTADVGASSVMFDASRRDYADNLTATRNAVQWAHTHGVWLEAELGEIGGKDGAHAPGARTDPGDARAFVEATGVDGLAVAVGSSHAMTERTAHLDLRLVAELATAVPVPLVLHGSSGVPDDTLRAAVQAGMVKVNIGTILNVAFTGAVRERLAAEPSAVDPRGYLRSARAAMTVEVDRLVRVIASPSV